MATYSGLGDQPIQEVPDTVLGGGLNEGVSYTPAIVLGDLAPFAVDFIPTDVLGDQAVAQVSYTPAYVLGDQAEIEVDYTPIAASANPPPAAVVSGRSYVQGQRTQIYQVPALKTAVDLTLVSTVGLLIVPVGVDLLLESVILELTNDDTATVDAQVSLLAFPGAGGASRTILANQTLTNFRTTGQVWVLRPANALSTRIAAGEMLVLSINTGATAVALEASARALGVLR